MGWFPVIHPNNVPIMLTAVQDLPGGCNPSLASHTHKRSSQGPLSQRGCFTYTAESTSGQRYPIPDKLLSATLRLCIQDALHDLLKIHSPEPILYWTSHLLASKTFLSMLNLWVWGLSLHFCSNTRFLGWMAGWYEKVKKLGERLMSFDFNLVFQGSMGSKFFQLVGEISSYLFRIECITCQTLWSLFFSWVPQFCGSFSLFLTLLRHLEKQHAFMIGWLTPLLE